MTENKLIPIERIAEKIYLIRDEKVMLDSDLADLYGVETRILVQAVKRNIERFPENFMFKLNDEEFTNLRSQIVMSSWGGRRHTPYAFTEHGSLMLSSILRSKQAVDVSISIVETFVRLREMLTTHKDVARKIEEHDQHIANLYAHVERLLTPKTNQKKPIGFIHPKDNK